MVTISHAELFAAPSPSWRPPPRAATPGAAAAWPGSRLVRAADRHCGRDRPRRYGLGLWPPSLGGS